MILVFVAVALAVLRIGGATSPAFQAFAHVFVGALLGAWVGDRCRDRLVLRIFVSLCVVELLCAIFLGGAH